MVDIVDMASDEIDRALLQTLSHRFKFDGLSRKDCEECGELIPEQRRALGGVRFCLECQCFLEKKGIMK